MAICSKCGKNVGCGCNLVNGLCAACRPIGKFFKKIFKLC